MRAIDQLEELHRSLPHRVRTARSTGLDTVRVTVAEAQAITAALPALLKGNADREARARREARKP